MKRLMLPTVLTLLLLPSLSVAESPGIMQGYLHNLGNVFVIETADGEWYVAIPKFREVRDDLRELAGREVFLVGFRDRHVFWTYHVFVW